MRTLTGLFVGLAFALTAMSCSSGGLGANASCKSFNNASSDDQTNAIQAMQRGHNDNTPATLARISVIAYCQFHSSGQISGVYSG